MVNPSPRHGSLQFWPRKRSNKIMPDVHWEALPKKDSGLLGFIGYKVGMKSAYLKDNTNGSVTKGKRIILPVTILECPTIKILSVRFYKNKIVAYEFINHNLDKELKRKIKLPKKGDKKFDDFLKNDFDNVTVVVYTQVKKSGIKKTPDIKEIGLSGTKEQKLEFIKNHLSKEITIKDVFKEGIVDIRGVTKGKGLQGTVKRFGLTLKAHKSEKGQRTLGSGGPWHPSRVDFHQPRSGQMGYNTRVCYNAKIVLVSNVTEKNINQNGGFPQYGNIKTDYIVLLGSVQGPQKRALLLTSALRATPKFNKKNYEFIELR